MVRTVSSSIRISGYRSCNLRSRGPRGVFTKISSVVSRTVPPRSRTCAATASPNQFAAVSTARARSIKVSSVGVEA